MTTKEKEQYEKAQAVNIEKLDKIDSKPTLSNEDKEYRSKIQTQYDIIKSKLNGK